jgi:glucose/arabinose dehydrogenase
MKNLPFSNKFSLFFFTAFIFLFSCSGGGGTKNTDESATEIEKVISAGLTVPAGFKAIVVADNLGRGRHITVNDNGDVYLALRQMNNDGGVACLRDTTGDGVADIIKYFGEHPGTGIGIRNGYLYVGADYGVYRYKMTEGELLPTGEAELIAGGFPDQGQHAVKPFAFDNEGNMYVNVGAPSNACMEELRTKGSPGMDPCPQLERQAGIWKFDADKPDQDQVVDGQRFATGIRNAVAITWNDHVDNLYIVQHGRDQLHQFYDDMYTVEESANLPAEEMFLVEENDDFGWPYCYYDQMKGKKVLAPEYGGDGEEVGRCAQMKDPILAFPAHIAPNDLMFYKGSQFPEKYKQGAFIAFHGSWNRGPLEEQGFHVAFAPFEEAMPTGEWNVFANGFAGEGPIMNTGDADYRPTGVTEGPDGSLYVSDSNEGKIWKIMYN